MNGMNVEFFLKGKNFSPIYIHSLLSIQNNEEDLKRLTGIVVSDPAKNESDDWLVVVQNEDGTFRSIDVYCLRVISKAKEQA